VTAFFSVNMVIYFGLAVPTLEKSVASYVIFQSSTFIIWMIQTENLQSFVCCSAVLN
jgi:hypothetical protein